MKKLESPTGYIKSLVAIYDEYPIYDHAIYIPDDAEKNYAEATEEEFEAYKKKQEEEAKKMMPRK
jgi:hypothetical protein